jgi:hypothetical protein
MSHLRGRLDLLALGLSVLVAFGLLAALAGRSFGRPLPLPTSPLPTPTRAFTPVATGWWDKVKLAPPALPALPGLPKPGLGETGAQAGAPVPFRVLSCPQATVRITGIVTGRPPSWLVSGSATIPNLEYWKAELSADGQGWTPLYRSTAPVADGQLIEFNTRTVPRGSYQLRLMAVDKTGNYGPPCTVALTVQ